MANKGYVYMMYNTDDWENSTPIYIGSCDNPKNRFYTHFKKLKNGKMTKEKYDSVKCIRIAETKNLADARQAERYFVGVHIPFGTLFNTMYMKEGVPSLPVDVSSLIFETLEEKDFRREVIPRKRRKFKDQEITNPLMLLDDCVLIRSWCDAWYTLYYEKYKPILIGFSEDFTLEWDCPVFSTTLQDEFDFEIGFRGIPEDRNKIITSGRLHEGKSPDNSDKWPDYYEKEFSFFDFMNKPTQDRLYCRSSERAELRENVKKRIEICRNGNGNQPGIPYYKVTILRHWYERDEFDNLTEKEELIEEVKDDFDTYANAVSWIKSNIVTIPFGRNESICRRIQKKYRVST